MGRVGDRWAGTAMSWLAGCLACCATTAVACLTMAPEVALAAGASSAGGSAASSPLGGPLVIPGSPGEGEQLNAARQAKLASPEAVAAREESQSEYENLNAEQAAKVAVEAFPAVIDEPAGGPPDLPAGQSITGYPTDNAAQVDLGEGESGVVESTAPMAIEDASGKREPIDLSLGEVSSAFEPKTPLVPIRIPKHLGAGVGLAGTGLSLTPVDAQGAALGGSEGALEGSSVVYANTQTDADTVIKPTTLGFEADTMLRSVQSPEQLYFKVGLPAGASLREAKGASGSVEVFNSSGATIATVRAPSADDAQGTPVPVSMSVSGDTLVLSVDRGSREYDYPIEVDPELEVNLASDSTVSEQTWLYHETPGAGFTYNGYGGGVRMRKEGADSPSQQAEVYYQTDGESKVYKVNADTAFTPNQNQVFGAEARIYFEFAGSGGYENKSVIASYGNPDKYENEACSSAGCSPAVGAEHNLVRLGDAITAYENGGNNLEMPSATVSISQPKSTHSTVSYNTSSPELEYTSGGKKVKTPNVIYTGGWIGPGTGAIEFTSLDKGVGVSETALAFVGYSPFFTKNYLNESTVCHGIQCPEQEHEVLAYTTFKNMPQGENVLRVSAHDVFEHTWSSEHGEGEHVIKLDAEAPHGITVTGLAGKEKELELGEVEAHIKVEATDGTGSTASSGIKSIALGVEEREIGKPAGSCPKGPCTASGEWTINGTELGAGTYTLTAVATDNAGNVSTENYTLTVHHASPIGAGPGSVNPASGDFALGASDVGVSGGAGALAVTRHYDSRNVKEGEEGPLGPQWTVSLGDLASLEVLPDGSVMSVGPEGLTFFKIKSGGGYESPEGDSNLTLELKGSEYLLKDATKGTTIKFTLPSGATKWMPTVSEGPVATDTTTDTYETVTEAGKTIVRPKLELAPHASASCPAGEPAKWEKGCRGLEFVYGAATVAKGENESEWGEYTGRLKEVKFTAYKPLIKMVTYVVAKYEYDKLGRLRAEWDPEISPALKTIYGYDAEGHVTALTPPGQESWAFTYGTIPGDSSTGRLLKVTRAPASAGLWNGKTVANTEVPKVSGTPGVGVRMSVSNGVWSNSPFVYGYQWEDCNSEGKECAPILGATNENYTPVSGDVGHTLVAQVSAVNGGGAVMVASAASTVVSAIGGTYVQTIDGSTSVSSVSCPSATTDCVVSDSAGKALYTTNLSSLGAATWTSWSGPSGQSPSQAVACPATSLCLLADGKESAGGKLFYATALGGSWKEAYSPSYGVDAIACVSVSFCVDGQDQQGSFRYSTSPGSTSWTEEHQSTAAMKGVSCLSSSFCAIADGAGKVHVATSTAQIESSTWKETDVDGSTALNGIACPSVKWCVAVDGVGNALKLAINTSGEATTTKTNIDGTNSLTAVTCVEILRCVAVDNAGNVFVAAVLGEGWTKEYTLGDKLTSVSCPSYSLCATVDTTGKVTAFNPNGHVGQGALDSPQPGSAIEYNVPLSGTGLPTLTKEEVEKWGQKDVPVVAAAVFPPDEPQGWPASGYKRATIDYMDGQARTVNTASPSGAISTKEYNEENAVTRSLGADNRATAMNEGCISVAKKECKSAEVAELRDTKSTYNAEGQLTNTWGPQHTIKIATGEKAGQEILARNQVRYYYDEGAKEVEEQTKETYNLVTKTVDAAETIGKAELDKRIATTSYSGQSNLGWKLRKPTSTTTDAATTTNPNGMNLTTTTKYQEITNAEGKKEPTENIEEVQGPAAFGKDAKAAPVYAGQFGTKGAGGGQFAYPDYDAVDAHGDVWVSDFENNRIEEFSSTGTFTEAIGFGVGSKGEEKLEICTSGCKAGKAGTGNGQFSGPVGIAISGGDIYVADNKNNRVEELTEAGVYVTKFGSKGTGVSQFEGPVGVAVSPAGNVWVGDLGNNRLEEFSSSGAFIEAVGWGVNGGTGKEEICTSGCKAGTKGSGNGQFSTLEGLAFSGTNLYVADYGNNRVEEFNESGKYVSKFGVKGAGEGQFEGPEGIATSATSGNLYVADYGNNRVQELTSSGAYLTQFGAKGSGNGQLKGPEGVAVNSTGETYVVDTGNSRVEEWKPAVTGAEGAHDEKTIYYTAKAEAEVAECRERPEWAGLPCQTKPVAQPGISGLPELPVTTIMYNIWDQPETVTEKFGSTTRTKKTTYESGSGRPTATEVTSSINTILSKVTDKYNKTNGSVEEQSTSEPAKTIVSKYNTLGQLETYIDAAGNTATFEYEKEGDARLVKVQDNKGNQTYHYDTTTGALSELVDSAAGAFKAEYDVAGRMTSESYPNAMTATYTHNQVGQATAIEYKKTAHCEKTCPEVWFSNTIVPSIHGETLKQSSTFSEEPSYTYDAAGRLTQAQETPSGEGCKTRIYAYDEDGNRTSETSREPGTEGKCASEGGSTEWHTYDTGDSLADPGVVYDKFGDTIELPAADAGGSILKSEYYVDGQVNKQSQGEGVTEKKLEYKLDPEERTLETITSGETASTVVSHYDGSGGALAWTGEGSGETEKWTRNIPGIDGALTATQVGEGKAGGAVTLQLHDLQGNVVGTVGNSETETKLLTKYNSTEFGVPSGKGAPPKYAWLGADGVAGELPSGVITQDGVTYVPQTGRQLQTEGITLPAPENAATPFTRPFEAWVGVTAGEGIAREVSAAEQEREKREKAYQPPGAIPVPEGEFCGEGYGPCAGEGGGGSGGRGCSGMNACAASNHHLCKIELKFGEPFGNELWAVGNFGCAQKVAHFEIQVCLFVEYPGKSKGYVGCDGKTTGRWWKNTSGASGYVKAFCSTGVPYRAWTWGRVYGMGALNEVISGGQSAQWVCAGRGTVDTITEIFEYVTS